MHHRFGNAVKKEGRHVQSEDVGEMLIKKRGAGTPRSDDERK